MDNQTFDTLFPTKRNSETQFRLLYTPYAQEQIVKLFEHYGDYELEKNGPMSTVISSRLTEVNFNQNSSQL
jgi:hypothetical protein